MSLNDRILFIPDLHEPFGHPDAYPFLRALKSKYNPTRFLFAGDEVDGQALKFHPRDPDLPSGGDEHDMAIERLKPLYKLFPNADVMESNHTSLIFRQAKFHGITKRWIRSYREALEAPEGWRWHKNLILTSGRTKIMWSHGIRKNALAVAIHNGMCFGEGHFHSEYAINYASSHGGTPIWGLNGGCLIDLKSPAFDYNENDLRRPILGASLIDLGTPKLLPLITDQYGRWNGVVP